MEEQELRAWLRLSRLELSPTTARTLIDHFGEPEAIFNATESELALVDRLTDKVKSKVLGPAPAAVDRDMHLIDEIGVTLIPLTSEHYPKSLKQIYDPPVLLYSRGQLVEADEMAVAIVGSRRATPYGISVAEKMARDLAGEGITIVSGGARGVDTAAHKGALAAGGRTIAFLGCGIDISYPAENRKLFDAIADSGAVISEFPFGSPPESWRFPPRNRLISGMSLGVLVCQSPAASGALITAGYAAEQGKDVYAVPGNIDDERNRGCHALIKDGAKLVECADDVLSELGFKQSEDRQTHQLALPIDSLKNENERQIAALLSLDPLQVDEIIEKTGLPAPMVAGTLTILEMKNVARRVPGNAYVRVL
ncbi:MAG: DNA-processing protein DprA [Armatimonadetes bacterium]|nr:DNA-processing protein DprA [Armatimonadota bacterium]